MKSDWRTQRKRKNIDFVQRHLIIFTRYVQRSFTHEKMETNSFFILFQTVLFATMSIAIGVNKIEFCRFKLEKKCTGVSELDLIARQRDTIPVIIILYTVIEMCNGILFAPDLLRWPFCSASCMLYLSVRERSGDF